MDASSGSTSRCCESRVLTYLCFALVGFVNSLLPFIVFSANYLIVPYPKWLVIIIEAAPALAIKLILPRFLHKVPQWMRPLILVSCWIIMAIEAEATPPNVQPLLRVVTSIFASATSAATEIAILEIMRHHGRAGLAGWSAGTGAGLAACALLPFALTVWMARFLRASIVSMYGLVIALALAYFAILPQNRINEMRITRFKLSDDKIDLEDIPIKHATSLETLLTNNASYSTRAAVKCMTSLALPLFLAFTAQAVIVPGITRSLPASPTFDSFFAFFTAYSLAFHVGNLVSRTFLTLFNVRNTRVPLGILGLIVIVMLCCTTFVHVDSFPLLGTLAFGAGLCVGTIYVAVFGTCLAERINGSGEAKGLKMQKVSAGETAGVLCGGIVGEMMLSVLCQSDMDGYERWCRFSR